MLVQFLLRLLFRPLRVLTLTLPRFAILLQVSPYTIEYQRVYPRDRVTEERTLTALTLAAQPLLPPLDEPGFVPTLAEPPLLLGLLPPQRRTHSCR